ncbi:cold-shock protein [Rhodobacter sp. TJ_12]|uniref:cold-shock protein n=1 Tax=Rhodobacter sp. TJ_12 TaxID=2029399 RepID=UPI001CBBB7A4|nr:cold shock domain-containing protein [Rhodobacter sp. TJ_12]MBZ4021681.1 cold-shock protein [Rhodobacter sp. TJ_12]
MVETESSAREVSGRVKWFDAGKGFGFILDGEGGPDILLHANVLRNFGQGSVADNAEIRVIVQATPRGAQATEVLEILPPDPETRLAPIEDLGDTDPEMVAALPLEPARVKWFDKAKGFGFANVFARPEDVFIHVEVLRRSGFADLAPGEAICLRVIEGRRGRMAAQVISWEVALRD